MMMVVMMMMMMMMLIDSLRPRCMGCLSLGRRRYSIDIPHNDSFVFRIRYSIFRRYSASALTMLTKSPVAGTRQISATSVVSESRTA